MALVIKYFAIAFAIALVVVLFKGFESQWNENVR